MAGESSEVNALEVAFTDQFEQKDLAGWVLDPSQWAFTNHGIQMVALGNSVAKTGNPQWTDFEYHASFTVHQFGATSAGGVTLLIRTNMSGPIKTYTLDFLKTWRSAFSCTGLYSDARDQGRHSVHMAGLSVRSW